MTLAYRRLASAADPDSVICKCRIEHLDGLIDLAHHRRQQLGIASDIDTALCPL